MSEFEKELEKNMKLGKVAHERESFYSDFLVSKRDIERIFEEWQPPKPLVEVPQCVDDAIKALPDYYSVYSAINYIRDKVNENEHWLDLYEWIFRESNVNEFARALLDGYTVEKEKLFYLKNKNTGHILYRQPKEAGGDLIEVVATINEEYTWFTQDEIDTMHTGSYEKIEVYQ